MVKKILIVNSFYSPDVVGGAEVVTQILAETLPEFGIKTVVLTTSDRERFDIINGIPIYRLHHRNIYWGKHHAEQNILIKPLWHTLNINNPFLMPRVKGILRRETPDLVLTHNIAGLSTGIWKVSYKFGLPVVHTLHDYSLLCLKSTMFKDNRVCSELCLSCRIPFPLKKSMTKYVKGIIAVSKFVLEQHRRYGLFVEIPATVVYNPVPFIPKRQHKDFHKPVFGYLGRLHVSKGIEHLLEVFKDIPCQLKVGGRSAEPEYGAYLSEKFRYPNIHFLGFVRASDFYKEIDVLIIPSLWNDPSPIVVHEANAFGIPVIGTRRGGLSEIIKPGINGLLYNPEDPEGLKDIVNTLIKDKRFLNQLSKSAYEYSRKFLPKEVAKRYVNVFQEVLGG